MRRNRLTLGALLVSALIATAACSGSESGGSSASLAEGDMAAGATSAAASAAAPAASATTGGKTAEGAYAEGRTANLPVQVERSIIRTAAMTVRTKDVAAQAARAEAATRGLGGLVGNAAASTDPDQPENTKAVLQLRVPGAHYDELITRLTALGEVVQKTEQASDVTAQVVDVQSRIETQRKSLQQVRALLTRAGTLSQVLLVERELTRREADLESLEAQRKVLADQTTLATIDLTLVTPKAAPPPPPPARHLGFVTGVIAGWHALVSTVVVAATAVGAVLPFALPLFLLVGLGLLVWRRFRHGPGVPAVADAD
jgi:hypothetical protein